MDFKKMADAIVAEMRDRIEVRLREAYHQGEAAMRERILQVASTPSAAAAPEAAKTVAVREEEPAQERAPRGLVREVVTAVLRDKPGLQVVDIEREVGKRDQRVAIKSVGNELRREKGKRYRRDGRLRWFLIGEAAEKETAGTATNGDPAASSSSSQGGSLWPTHPN